MIRGEELREALAPFEKIDGEMRWLRADTDGKSWSAPRGSGTPPNEWVDDRILDAARAFLPILEQHSELRSRIFFAVCNVFDDDTDCDEITEAVLAALIPSGEP